MTSIKAVGITTPINLDRNIKTAEDLITYCARVSNPSNQNNVETGERLLKYLLKANHWSPFEMVDVIFEVKTTRDVGRQLLRHWSFRFQEFSQRYSDEIEFSPPKEARLQDLKNRQNSIEVEHVTLQNTWNEVQKHVIETCKWAYTTALAKGIAKECARVVLPEGLTMSTMYAKADLRTLINYVRLRTGNGTQKEHMVLAQMIRNSLSEMFPSLNEVLNEHSISTSA